MLVLFVLHDEQAIDVLDLDDQLSHPVQVVICIAHFGDALADVFFVELVLAHMPFELLVIAQ